jgi:hypothetical protein
MTVRMWPAEVGVTWFCETVREIGSATARSSELALAEARSAEPFGILPWVSTRTAAVSAALLIAGSLPW